MIYLIKQLSWNPDHCMFKPGYSNNLDRRLTQYTSSCPTTLFISSRPGELIEETIIHAYLHGLNDIKFIKSEWYEVSNDRSDWFINEFSKSYDDMEKYLLENLAFISNNTLKNYLLEKYYPDSIKSKSPKINIDSDIEKLYSEHPKIRNKFEAFCIYMELNKNNQELIKSLENKYQGSEFLIFYTHFGYKTCKAHCFNCTELSRMMQQYLYTGGVISEVIKIFEPGKRYTCKYIKETLKSIYSTLGVSKTAKATDLDEYLTLRPCKAQDQDGKWQKGFEIISIK